MKHESSLTLFPLWRNARRGYLLVLSLMLGIGAFAAEGPNYVPAELEVYELNFTGDYGYSSFIGPVESAVRFSGPGNGGKKEGKGEENRKCEPEVSAVFSADCEKVKAYSTKDLSNVVLLFCDGTVQKFDGLSGKKGVFAGTDEYEGLVITGIWIKSGCNKSGDGPGYGAFVANPAGDKCCGICEAGPVGSPCDDENPETVYDRITEDCVCAGECPYIMTEEPTEVTICNNGTVYLNAFTNADPEVFDEIEYYYWFDERQENPYEPTSPKSYCCSAPNGGTDPVITTPYFPPGAQVQYVYACLKPMPTTPGCFPFVEYIITLDEECLGGGTGHLVEVNNSYANIRGGSSGKLYVNRPNPFTHQTVVSFDLEAAASGQITLMDISGRTLRTIRGTYSEGYNEVSINRDDLPAGLLLYRVQAGNTLLTGKMMVGR